jgi:hypothetical protein
MARSPNDVTPRLAWTVVGAVLVSAACAPASGVGIGDLAGTASESVLDSRFTNFSSFEGLASWYGPGFAGRRTASGEVFDPSLLTAAHKTLPFGTRVRVVNLENGRSVDVRITDRGPFKPGRVIDLSRAAAEAIGMIGSGVAQVRVEPLEIGAGAFRLAVATDLRGFEARSDLHPAGALLLLRSDRSPDPFLVRVVSGDAGSGADLFVAPELYLVLGPVATVRVD